MDINLHTVKIGDWVARMRVPPGESPHPVMLMLHGWTGDENAMWVFASRFPTQYILLALRGLYPTPMGGYGWHPYKANAWPKVDDFRPAVEALQSLLTAENLPYADCSRVDIVGFSQGSALGAVFALLHPQRVASLAILSGFLPEGASVLAVEQPLLEMPVFITHGTEDTLVPVERARQGIDIMQRAGARVHYCEDNVGHKLSASCFRGLEMFYRDITSR